MISEIVGRNVTPLIPLAVSGVSTSGAWFVDPRELGPFSFLSLFWWKRHLPHLHHTSHLFPMPVGKQAQI